MAAAAASAVLLFAGGRSVGRRRCLQLPTTSIETDRATTDSAGLGIDVGWDRLM